MCKDSSLILRRQDKASCLAAGTSFLSVCLHTVFRRSLIATARCVRAARPILSFVINGKVGGIRTVQEIENRLAPQLASRTALRPYAAIYSLVFLVLSFNRPSMTTDEDRFRIRPGRVRDRAGRDSRQAAAPCAGAR